MTTPATSDIERIAALDATGQGESVRGGDGARNATGQTLGAVKSGYGASTGSACGSTSRV